MDSSLGLSSFKIQKYLRAHKSLMLKVLTRDVLMLLISEKSFPKINKSSTYIKIIVNATKEDLVKTINQA